MRTATTKTPKQQEKDRAEAIAKLREVLKPGQEVHTVLRHVSKSGMQREISLVITDPRDLNPWCIDYLVSTAIGYRIGKHRGIVVSGCGTDAGFHIVYRLGRALWPDGVPGDDGSIGGPDRDGGYALKHRWL